MRFFTSITLVSLIFYSTLSFAEGSQDCSSVFIKTNDDSTTTTPKIIKTELKNGKATATLYHDGTLSISGDKEYGGKPSEDIIRELHDIIDIKVARGLYYGSFIALRKDGVVIAWGSDLAGGDISNIKDKLVNVVAIYSNEYAYAALRIDGSVITWGEPDLSQFPNETISLPLKDGGIVIWGATHRGGDSSSVSEELSSGVISIIPVSRGFVALKNDGSVVCWGDDRLMKKFSEVKDQLTSGVKKVVTDGSALMALKNGGSVVAWNLSRTDAEIFNKLKDQLSSGVSDIVANKNGFAFIKEYGSVLFCGWESSENYNPFFKISHMLQSGVKSITATKEAFAALKYDGSVITWGHPYKGGDSLEVRSDLIHVKEIYSNDYAFVAVRENGTAIGWGLEPWIDYLKSDLKNKNILGTKNISIKKDPSKPSFRTAKVVKEITLKDKTPYTLLDDGRVLAFKNPDYLAFAPDELISELHDIVDIQTTRYSVAALRKDGSVIAWGNKGVGGDTSEVKDQLLGGVKKVLATFFGFLALKDDGTVVCWGKEFHASDESLLYSKISDKLTNIKEIYTNGDNLFAALRSDGTLLIWGANFKDINTYGTKKVSDDFVNIEKLYSSKYVLVAIIENVPSTNWENKDDIKQLLDSFGYNNHDVDQNKIDLPVSITTDTKEPTIVKTINNNGSMINLYSDGKLNEPEGFFIDYNFITELYDIVDIIPIEEGFAALRQDGQLLIVDRIYSISRKEFIDGVQKFTDITTITSDGKFFKAIKQDGSIVTFDSTYNSSYEGED